MSKTRESLSRRKFINLSIQGCACIPLAHGLPTGIYSLAQDISSDSKTYHGVCYHDCPDSCSWHVKTENGKLKSFKANKEHPYTNGKLCLKMDSFPQDITFNPTRLLTPLKRIGKKGEGHFTRISWEQALEEVADKLKQTVSAFGPESVLPFGYAGTQGMIQKNLMSNRFFAKLGSAKLAGTICGAAADTGHALTNGSSNGILPEDIVHSSYIILWGTNTKHTNIHLWPFIEQARENGAKLVVIDPFKSSTAKDADQHIQLKPGTDVALALGMMHVIIKEDLIDKEYIDSYTLGFEALKNHVKDYSPLQVSELCGLDENEIIELAREYAKSETPLIRVLIGLEHNYNGGDAFRAVAMLPSLIGAWRYQGGGLLHFTYAFFGEALNYERLNFYKKLEAKERPYVNMIQLGTALSDDKSDPEIKSLFVYNSNPAVTIPNQNLVRKGLEREDLLTVVIEHFMTDTALYADYVFPATTQLEHWDVADSWGQVYVSLNQPAFAPLGEAKSNSEFFRLLARQMAYTDECFNETDKELVQSIFDTDHHYMEGISFEYMQKHGWAKLKIPEPYMPYAKGKFPTSSGKCEFYSEALEEQGSSIPSYKKPNQANNKKYPFQLLTIKYKKGFLNSSHANVKHLIKNAGEPTLDINIKDADARNLKEGDTVKVFNQNGSINIKTRISDRVRSGVLLMPQGYWPSLIDGNATANALTSDMLTDHGSGSAMQDCYVQLEKI